MCLIKGNENGEEEYGKGGGTIILYYIDPSPYCRKESCVYAIATLSCTLLVIFCST